MGMVKPSSVFMICATEKAAHGILGATQIEDRWLQHSVSF